MYHFAQKGWNQQLSGGFTIWVVGFTVEIDIESSQGQHGSFDLQTCHIILGLYETMVEVSAQSRFCEVLTTLSLHRRQIGVLTIQKRTSSTQEKDGANATRSLMANGFSSSNVATYPSGQITDADDARFTVTYIYSGIRINSKDIFLAALDALATAAQFSPDTSFTSLNAISASGYCVISIAMDGSQSQMSYSYVTKALRAMISSIVVVLRRFEEVTFQLNWRGNKMVEGSIRLADHGVTA